MSHDDEAQPPEADLGVRLAPITRLAARLVDVPMAAVAQFPDGAVYLKGPLGVSEDWPLARAFARRHRGCREPFISLDLAVDPDAGDLRDHAAGVRFFAAVPLPTADGHGVHGFLCVADTRPRESLGAADRQALVDLAAAAADIAGRALAEDQRDTLVAELDHRIKNVLAAVQSLALQSARRAASLEGFLKTFTGRLKSMASAHQLLTATRWRGAGMRNLAAAELGGLAPGQTRWEGPDFMLTPRAANAMSLALHELATNAIKFGALSVESGRVEVHWRSRPDGGLTLEWIESDGPPVSPPTRHGFGSTLLEKVTGREMDGDVKVDYRHAGVRAVLNAAASAIAEPVAATSAPAAEAVPPPIVGGASSGARHTAEPVRIHGLRLLIVEDALLLTLELEAGLQEAGAQIVGSAADVDEAMRMVDMPLDAAVLDANLNGVSVLPVAEALAARGVPFVFATGYGDSKMAPQGFGAPVIRKPYDVTQVAAALAEVTGRA
jgi:two-component sensor histidine kinase/CheY-like chemotaxis protein